MEYDVELSRIKKKFNNQTIVNNFNLQIKKGEFISFLGPSGCGKTTTLNMIAGFLEPDEGELLIKGKRMNGVPPYKRDLGMVFQTYSLFPHMNIFENVAYGLKLRRVSKSIIAERVKTVLDLVRLAHVEDRFPNQLSGGQRQRIAIARALVMEPSILLLDEPLSNLDAQLREELRDELKRLHQRIGVTTIFVTHDQEEALSLSDRIVVLSHGNIEQIGTPLEIYHQPKTEFVHTFIGKTNRFEGTIEPGSQNYLRMRTERDLYLNTCDQSQRFKNGEKVSLFVRPETIKLSKETLTSDITNSFTGNIKSVNFLGAITEYTVTVGKHEVTIRTQEQCDLVEGSIVSCYWKMEDQLLVKREA
jgi:putative spermidine/putrescine transport system ATP-binding protein